MSPTPAPNPHSPLAQPAEFPVDLAIAALRNAVHGVEQIVRSQPVSLLEARLIRAILARAGEIRPAIHDRAYDFDQPFGAESDAAAVKAPTPGVTS